MLLLRTVDKFFIAQHNLVSSPERRRKWMENADSKIFFDERRG
jgi:hypothetical protein